MLAVLQPTDLDLVSYWMGGININFSPLDLLSSGSRITAAQDGVGSVQLVVAYQKLLCLGPLLSSAPSTILCYVSSLSRRNSQ